MARGDDDLDLHRLVLVVAHGYLPRALRDAAADDVVIHLAAVSHYIEGLSHLDAHPLTTRRVVDSILAYELLSTAWIGLIHAHDPLRKRNTQIVRRTVLEVEVDAEPSSSVTCFCSFCPRERGQLCWVPASYHG